MAKSKKANKVLTLEDILFNCRNLLRSKASIADKRDLILTLVFLKFIGEKFDKKQQEIIQNLTKEGFDEEFISISLVNPDAYGDVFYLDEEIRWAKIVEENSTTLAVKLDSVINLLEQRYASLKGALPQKIFTKTNLGSKTLKSLVDEVNKISADKFHEKDLIGRVYEYFLQAFAIQAEKDDGEFYTPHSIVELIAAIIEPFDGAIYDPCCGSGGIFVQSAKLVDEHGGNKSAISVYGQEMQPETFRLAKMNLAVRGINSNLGSEPASTFLKDQHPELKVPYIMANPPFNFKNWRGKEQLLSDPRWAGYETPPVSNANYAWILHMLSKLDVNRGRAGFLLANGALGDSDTVKIREHLIKNDKVEAIVLLPRNMFYSTDISVPLWILNQNK